MKDQINAESTVTTAPASLKPKSIVSRLRNWRGGWLFNITALTTVTIFAITGRELLARRADTLLIKPQAPTPVSVEMTTIHPEKVASGRHYSGVVKELQRAELSFRVGGTIESLHQIQEPDGHSHNIHEGDTVRIGTPLAQLDLSDYRRQQSTAAAKLSNAKAKFAQAEADANFAAAELQRFEKVVERGGLTRSELENARAKRLTTLATLEASRHEIETARIALEQSTADLSYGTLTMPFSEGTVAARYIHAGERLAANQRAFLVLDVSSVIVAFAVPDTLVVQLRLGDILEVTTEAFPGLTFEGRIHKIGSTANEQTRSYDVEVRIDQPAGMRPGMFATVHFRHEMTAYLLPFTAIVPRSGTNEFDVFAVVQRDGQAIAHRIPVMINDVVDNRVSIQVDGESGLRDGQYVVTTGTHRLYDGQAVQGDTPLISHHSPTEKVARR